MSNRSRPRPRRDHAIFSRTAAGTKRINVDPKNYRGGIRL